jgi:aryl-alcohol dehydrogenase-like predicted oxidoreductase
MDHSWPGPGVLRVGLGCMRMSTGETRDIPLALHTIAAAADSGITVFDTAHAYGRDETELGHNEQLVGRALRACGAAGTARIVTKCGMTRAGGGWMPDGRAGALLADCEASLAALDGLPIELLLLHAPDPRTPWRTSLRALARILGEGLVRRVGVSNVNRAQLDQARDIVDISAIQIGLSVFDENALRSGIVEHCAAAGIAVMAHSPLGGPRRVARLARNEAVAGVAARHGATPAEIALAWLLDRSPAVVVIPGARRTETVRSAARAALIVLDASDRTAIAASFDRSRDGDHPRIRALDGAEVVLLMGIPGAGKSHIAKDYVTGGYQRLNRDERGGSLRDLAVALDAAIVAGGRKFVLDNTYLTRAVRSYVIEAAGRHRVPVRCVWMDTPLAQAQVNLIERMLARLGSLPGPDALRVLSRREPGLLMPTSQMRAQRELEPPADDEGFAAVERIPFERIALADEGRPGVFVAAAALARPGWNAGFAGCDRALPHLAFDWSPDGTTTVLDAAVARLAGEVSGQVHGALCPHGDGPPQCWCRPPLPGLLLAFARVHDLDAARSTLIGAGPAHRTLANTLGARYIQA